MTYAKASAIVQAKAHLDAARKQVSLAESALQNLTSYDDALKCGNPYDAEAVMMAEIAAARNWLEGYRSSKDERRGGERP